MEQYVSLLYVKYTIKKDLHAFKETIFDFEEILNQQLKGHHLDAELLSQLIDIKFILKSITDELFSKEEKKIRQIEYFKLFRDLVQLDPTNSENIYRFSIALEYLPEESYKLEHQDLIKQCAQLGHMQCKNKIKNEKVLQKIPECEELKIKLKLYRAWNKPIKKNLVKIPYGNETYYREKKSKLHIDDLDTVKVIWNNQLTLKKIQIEFTEAGSETFRKLTKQQKGNYLCFAINSKIYSCTLSLEELTTRNFSLGEFENRNQLNSFLKQYCSE